MVDGDTPLGPSGPYMDLDAANVRISNLEAHNSNLRARLKSAMRWIPCSERMPELDAQILFVRQCPYIELGWRVYGGFYSEADDDVHPVSSVTHWMPEPELP